MKIRDLFNLNENGLYKYKGEFPLQIGDRVIEIEQWVDLEQLNLESAFKDDITLHLNLIEDVYHLKGLSYSV